MLLIKIAATMLLVIWVIIIACRPFCHPSPFEMNMADNICAISLIFAAIAALIGIVGSLQLLWS